MIKNNLKIAFRHLRKQKMTSIINIGGLALGMAVALMVGLWVQDELSFNQHHQNYDRLAQVYLNGNYNGEIRTSGGMAIPLANILQEEYGTNFEHIALATSGRNTLEVGEQQFLRRGLFVESDFVEMFSLEFSNGGSSELLNNRNNIFITEKLARTLFGNKNAIGEIIRLGGENDLEIKGVFKDMPSNSSFNEVEYLVGWNYALEQFNLKRHANSWGEHSFSLYTQITKNTDFDSVSATIKDIEKKYNSSESVNPELFLFPMSKWHLYANFKNGKNAGGAIQFVWLFSIIGIFVLLLACINFMNLSTARSEKRAKEVGVRKTIGSGKGQLVAQFLSESVVTAMLAMILSLAIVFVSMNWFNHLTYKQLVLPIANPTFVLGLLGFTLLTGLLAGSYPAFYLSSFHPLQVLKGTFKTKKGGGLPRQVLVTLQFSVSIALIIGTLIIFQQINYAKNRALGYKQENIIQFFSSPELEGKYEVLNNEVKNTGFVSEFSYASSQITNYWSNQSGFNWEGKDPNFTETFGVISCAANFGETLGWEIVEGRDFSSKFSTDSSGIILSQSAADLIGMESIVGKTVVRWGKPYQVLGVIEDLMVESPWDTPKPAIFFNDIERANVFFIRMKDGVNMKNAIASVEKVYKEISPSMPFVYEFVDEEYNSKFQAEERIGQLANVFALLAILISCLGIFGLSAFVAERKNKEIGIRKVLGASIGNLWILQSKGFVKLVILSCLIAIPVSWYFLENWLSQYDYRIEIGWEVFVISSLLALMVTLFTVSFQSVKAALVNPIKSLRSE